MLNGRTDATPGTAASIRFSLTKLQQRPSVPSFASLIESKLTADTVEVLRTAGELAVSGEHGASDVYLVGGSVRDLVLGRSPKDPDIVVVGNGTLFARSLAEAIKGTVASVSQFGTTIIDSPLGSIDVATARSETYSEPGALPVVHPAEIDLDLRRRDFSVNAMAVALSPQKWGTLLDPYHGFGDAARRRLRILHDRSFQDDPTRILRAVRYSVRLGFSFEVATAEALERDLHFIDSLSSARVLAEIEKILQEPDRAAILRRAEELGIIGAISPSLRVTETGLKAMEQIGASKTPVDELLYVACMSSSLTSEEATAVIGRLQPDKDWQAVMHGASAFREVATLLETPDLLPSEVVELLERVPAPVLGFQRIAGPRTRRREHIEAYLRRHRDVRAEITGDALAEQGVPRGPLMGKLLLELKVARLNGKVSSKDEELELVKRRLPILLSREASETDNGSQRPTGAAIP
jgi:tRNA nucleotidyltransferase (CCA-adding enzyme)